MKTYFSKRGISICAGRTPINFVEVTGGYRFSTNDIDSQAFIESLPLFVSGDIYIEQDTAKKEDTRDIPVTHDKDEEDMEIVNGVTKCTDALAFLKARWPEAKDLRSRASILAFAESKRISFPDLPKQ